MANRSLDLLRPLNLNQVDIGVAYRVLPKEGLPSCQSLMRENESEVRWCEGNLWRVVSDISDRHQFYYQWVILKTIDKMGELKHVIRAACMGYMYEIWDSRWYTPLLCSSLLPTIHHPHSRPDTTIPHSILVEILEHLTRRPNPCSRFKNWR